jgi:hypothetical protein
MSISQANAHVRLSFKAESQDGHRLNPRKADLHRWRETFAEQLRELGIDAEASRQAARVVNRTSGSLWRIKAKQEARLRVPRRDSKVGASTKLSRDNAQASWRRIAAALANSESERDRQLARQIAGFVKEAVRARDVTTTISEQPAAERPAAERPGTDRGSGTPESAWRGRPGPELHR